MTAPRLISSITALLFLFCVVGSVASTATEPGQALSTTQQSPIATLSSNVTLPETAMLKSPLPGPLSPWQMFVDADLVVKLVIVLLSVASLITWTIAIAKQQELRRIDQTLQKQIASIALSVRLSDIAESEQLSLGVGKALLTSVQQELDLASTDIDKEGVKERALSRINRIEAAIARQMAIGTGLLASIGSTSPFVGLFGTVWGIMNAFIGISESKTTNLAVVAPGIAEALLATAMGLVAAIPAVVIYNHFSRRISATRAHVSDLSAILMQLLSRDLDLRTPPSPE
ncbi:MAG: tonB-system energizer ExbB [Immundisolibacteraceae bacterium]|nr:tonB-system energizer ExbB [Immundisolibacteraceae bacterium]